MSAVAWKNLAMALAVAGGTLSLAPVADKLQGSLRRWLLKRGATNKVRVFVVTFISMLVIATLFIRILTLLHLSIPMFLHRIVLLMPWAYDPDLVVQMPQAHRPTVLNILAFVAFLLPPAVAVEAVLFRWDVRIREEGWRWLMRRVSMYLLCASALSIGMIIAYRFGAYVNLLVYLLTFIALVMYLPLITSTLVLFVVWLSRWLSYTVWGVSGASVFLLSAATFIQIYVLTP